MSQPRDHHFVPVFYLKQWTNQDGKLIEYSKPHGNKIVDKSVGPRATGFQRDLYAFPNCPPELAQYLEARFLQKADEEASFALKKLRTGSADPPWTPALRSSWSRFVINFRIRHPHPFAEVRATTHDHWLNVVTQQEYETMRGPNDPPNFQEWVLAQGDNFADRIRIRFLQTAMDNERIGGRINSISWNVLDLSGANFRLLTSDWPLSLEIEGQRMRFLLPLSPTILFIATTHHDLFQELRGSSPTAVVRKVNLATVSQARLYVYSRDRSQGQFISNRMSTNKQVPPFFPSLARGAANPQN